MERSGFTLRYPRRGRDDADFKGAMKFRATVVKQYLQTPRSDEIIREGNQAGVNGIDLHSITTDHLTTVSLLE